MTKITKLISKQIFKNDLGIFIFKFPTHVND